MTCLIPTSVLLSLFFGFQKNTIVDARVYDHLVDIPSLNSCIPTEYYVFDYMLLVNKASIFGSVVTFSAMND